MIEKGGSLYHIFKDYLRKDVVDWAEKTSKEALVDYAPRFVRQAFDDYIKKRNERLRKGRIS